MDHPSLTPPALQLPNFPDGHWSSFVLLYAGILKVGKGASGSNEEVLRSQWER